MNNRKGIVFLACLFLSTTLFAKSNGSTNYLAVGQGISSPTLTSTVNYTSGWTYENPVGVIYQNQARITGEFSSSTNNSYGGELGTGNGKYGVAIGYLNNDCTGCDGSYGAAFGADFGGIGMGLGYHKDVVSVGFLFSPHGSNRLGVTLDLHNNALNSKVVGVGYSYVDSSFTFTLDASKLIIDSTLVDDSAILLTPGLSFKLGFLALTVSYDTQVNSSSSNGGDVWFGLGLGEGKGWHLAAYKDYSGDWSVAGSLFF